MNNKGFTLIETILVIAILAIMTIILVPSVTGLINKNKTDSYINLINSIERAASLYVSDNRYNKNIVSIDCSGGASKSFIYLKTLIDSGDLSSPVVDPRNKKNLDTENNYVTVTFNCLTKQFTYEVSFSETISPNY